MAHLFDLNCNLSPNPSKYESVIYPPLEHYERTHPGTPRQFVTLLSIRGAEMATCGLSQDIIPHQGFALPYNPSSRGTAAPQSQKCSAHRVIVVTRVQNIYKCIIFASLHMTIFKHLGFDQLTKVRISNHCIEYKSDQQGSFGKNL